MSIIEKSTFKINCTWLGFTHCCVEKSHHRTQIYNTLCLQRRRSVGIRVSIIFTKDIEEVLTNIILMLAGNIKLERVLKPRKQKGKEK